MPEPHLKSMPSVLARSRMDSSESFTEMMKQAEHCGRVSPVAAEFDASAARHSSASSARRSWARFDRTDVEPDRRVEAAFWCSIRCASSSRKFSASSAVRK